MRVSKAGWIVALLLLLLMHACWCAWPNTDNLHRGSKQARSQCASGGGGGARKAAVAATAAVVAAAARAPTCFLTMLQCLSAERACEAWCVCEGQGRGNVQKAAAAADAAVAATIAAVDAAAVRVPTSLRPTLQSLIREKTSRMISFARVGEGGSERPPLCLLLQFLLQLPLLQILLLHVCQYVCLSHCSLYPERKPT